MTVPDHPTRPKVPEVMLFQHGEDVVKRISQEFGITVEMIKGHTNSKTVVKARWACVLEMVDVLDMSRQEVGYVLGREVGTITHMYKRAKKFNEAGK